MAVASSARVMTAAAAAVAASFLAVLPALAETAIDPARSTVTVSVAKSGLFSAFADNHTIRAPISAGTISDQEPLSVTATVRTADLKVLDPGLSAGKRADVQMRMEGPEVLDIAKFPEIRFTSTSVQAERSNRWMVTGQLTIHGQTKTISFPVIREQDTYRGTVAVKQHDFGITPITVAGGTVKVKDELKIEFVVAGRQ